MAQVTQATQSAGGNTNNPRRARNWCFTLNNYTENDIKHLESEFKDTADYTFQQERGANGTKHLQGVVCFKNAVSFKHVKNILPQAHIEICKNKRAAISYCSKAETRDGEIYSNIRVKMAQVTQKKRTLLETKFIKENKINICHIPMTSTFGDSELIEKLDGETCNGLINMLNIFEKPILIHLKDPQFYGNPNQEIFFHRVLLLDPWDYYRIPGDLYNIGQ